jgi:hypothetical protein
VHRCASSITRDNEAAPALRCAWTTPRALDRFNVESGRLRVPGIARVGAARTIEVKRQAAPPPPLRRDDVPVHSADSTKSSLVSSSNPKSSA